MKRGVSTVVVIVLITLITVSGVAILWVSLDSFVSVDLSVFDTDLHVVTSGGYTFYDDARDVVLIQVETRGSKSPDYVQAIIVLDNGKELISVHDAPTVNSRKTLYLNADSTYTEGAEPVFVSVAPIFIVDGDAILGRRVATIELPKREEFDTFYNNLGESDSPEDVSVTYVSSVSDLTEFSSGGGGGGGGGPTCSDGIHNGDEEGVDCGGSCPACSGFEIIHITDCGTLDASHTEYVLQNNISTASTCFTITNDSVILNLNGFSVVGDDTGLDYGIYIDAYSNISILNGHFYDFLTGVLIANSNSNTITNVVSNSNQNNGLELLNTFDTSITNVVTNLNTFFGIQLSDSNNNYLTNVVSNNNSGSPFVGEGIFLIWSNGNVLKNVTANYNNNIGLHAYLSNNNNLTDFIGNKNNIRGILISSSSNNVLQNVYLDSVRGIDLLYSSGIQVLNVTSKNSNYSVYMNDAHNNLFYDFYLTNCSRLDYTDSCIYIFESSNNNFTNGNIGVSKGNGIIINSSGSGDSSDNNYFRDVSMLSIDYAPVWLSDALGSENLNTTFVNVSYPGFPSLGPNSDFIQRWYYQAYVEQGGSPLELADVTVTKLGDPTTVYYDSTTNSSGLTDTIILTGYSALGGVYTNYQYRVDINAPGILAFRTHPVLGDNIVTDNFVY